MSKTQQQLSSPTETPQPSTVPTGDAALIDLSDIHAGSSLALWHPDITLPKGAHYNNNSVQEWLWEEWLAFIKWQKRETKKRRRTIVINGDAVQGIRDPFAEMVCNLSEYQQNVAVALVEMLRQPGDTIIVIRGTPYHDGPEGSDAEAVAGKLRCAVHNGDKSSNFLPLIINGVRINVTHHIATSRSPVSKMTGLMSAMAMTNAECGQWGRVAPDILLRAHRHEYAYIHQGGKNMGQAVVTTPCWCAKGEFAVKVSPNTIAHIGGVVIPIDADGTWRVLPRFTAIQADEEVVL